MNMTHVEEGGGGDGEQPRHIPVVFKCLNVQMCKETVSRDFVLQVFFMNHPPPSP
jgi:hypothetical protein